MGWGDGAALIELMHQHDTCPDVCDASHACCCVLRSGPDWGVSLGLYALAEVGMRIERCW